MMSLFANTGRQLFQSTYPYLAHGVCCDRLDHGSFTHQRLGRMRVSHVK